MRILIVEDDPAVRPFLDAFLTLKGFNTLSAWSAEHAESLLLDFPTPPAVAVLDLMLPGLSGLRYADMLRARYPGIRVVFITGWPEGIDLADAEKRGWVLRKPFSPADLLHAVQFQMGS